MDLFDQHEPVAGKFEQSAYYYWYRYMQLVEGYGPGHPLWEDFGDVQLPFWNWWCSYGEDLFMTGENPGFDELVTDEDIQQARADGAYIVRIDPGCTRDYLALAFRDFMEERGIRKVVGRRKMEEEGKFARRRFAQRPDIRSLRFSLEAWLLRQQKDPKLTLYQIGCLLKVNPSAVIRKKDTAADRLIKKNTMNATVSRYLRWAKNIKKNVAKGLFPKTD